MPIIATASVPEQHHLEHCSTVDITALRATTDPAEATSPTCTVVTTAQLDTEDWAREFIGRPAVSDADRRAQEIVANLLEQVEAERQSPDEGCPSWCRSHCPCDDGAIIHIGDYWEVTPTAGGPAEHRPMSVSVEQFERPDSGLEPAAIRLNDTPMKPDEALELADFLRMAARQAMERPA